MKTAIVTFLLLSMFSLTLLAQIGNSVKTCKSEIVRYSDKDFEVQALRYLSANPGQKTVIIIPPTGGTNFLDRGYAERFCESGFDVFILDHWTDDDEYNLDLEIHQRFYARVQRGLGMIINDIKSPFVGVFGTSVGGIHTAVAMGMYERLDAAFVVVGGASVAEIIVNSDQGVLADAKKKRFEIFGFKSDQQYLEALEKAFALEPLKLPRLFEGKPLAMVISSKDGTVPSKNQQDLRDFWRPQTVYERSQSHIPTVFRTWLFDKQKIVEFFNQAYATSLRNRIK